MRTEPRAQLHKPVKKNFLLILGCAPAPGAPPPAYATECDSIKFIVSTQLETKLSDV